MTQHTYLEFHEIAINGEDPSLISGGHITFYLPKGHNNVLELSEIRFHISYEDKDGFSLSEIINNQGSHLHDGLGSYDTSNLVRKTAHGTYEGEAETIPLSLSFPQKQNANLCTLSIFWPDKEPHIRHFLQIGQADLNPHWERVREITYLEEKPDDPNDFLGLRNRAQLDILLLPEQIKARHFNKLRFTVSKNIDVALINDQDSAFKGFGVNEIPDENGYYFANGISKHFESADPFFDVSQGDIPGVYEAEEGNISIRLIFSEASAGKLTLIHKWPDQEAHIRVFHQVGNYDFLATQP